jgi:uncharacterized repeat protein (TIGR01451 family)
MDYRQATKSARSRRGTVGTLAAAVMVTALMAMPVAHADTLVGCDTAALIGAITNANSSGGDTLDLSAGCTYTLTSGPYSDGVGPDGLPIITSAITIHGNGATITRDTSAPAFRLIEMGGGSSLTADHLTLSQGNSAGPLGGGAILNLNAAVTLTNSSVSANIAANVGTSPGGGISNFATVTLTNSTLSDNSADGPGGGIYNSTSGTATLTNSTVSGNGSNSGGGIANSGGTLRLTNTTLSTNSAGSFGGGGINNEDGGTATLTNTTVSANGTSGAGGGIENVGSGSMVTLTNSIVANSTSGGNCSGNALTDGGYNLDSGTTCGLSAATDKNSVDPQVGPLQGNGGPTSTMALASTSAAIDAVPAGTNGCGTTITTDQRGVPRPQGSGCDMGAYEFGDLAMQALTASPTPVPRLTKLTYTATVVNAGAVRAKGVKVTDTLPPGEKLKSASASQGSCSVSAQQVTCNLGKVPAATSATVTIVVKVKAATGSTLTDTATVSATTGDSIPGNDSKTVSVMVS